MVRRTKPKKTRPRRDKGGGGVTPPSRGRSATDWGKVAERVNVSYEVLGHPQQAEKPVEEDVHYEVLAYTDWADQFIPTVVKWSHGEVDDFSNLEQSRENMDRARLRELRLKRIREQGIPRERADEMYKEEMRQARAKSQGGRRNRTWVAEVTSNIDDGVYGVTVEAPDIETAKELGYRKLSELYPEHGDDYSIYEDKSQGRAGKPQVRKMFDRFDVPYYGVYDPEGDMWLHEDGSWSKPYPERGRLWYAVTEEAAQRKLSEYTANMSRLVKPPGDALPVGGGTLMVGSREYVWRLNDRDYAGAQRKAAEIREKGYRAVIRKEQVAGKPGYAVYAREIEEGEER